MCRLTTNSSTARAEAIGAVGSRTVSHAVRRESAATGIIARTQPWAGNSALLVKGAVPGGVLGRDHIVAEVTAESIWNAGDSRRLVGRRRGVGGVRTAMSHDDK